MKFLIDAQLPRRLARWLGTEGHDAVHTMDLPAGNRTEDAQINAISIREQRIVVTKDVDFVDTFLLQRAPRKLLLVTTGNIGNSELVRLFEDNLDSIVHAFETSDFIAHTQVDRPCTRSLVEDHEIVAEFDEVRRFEGVDDTVEIVLEQSDQLRVADVSGSDQKQFAWCAL